MNETNKGIDTTGMPMFKERGKIFPQKADKIISV
jgi:hypothetical protein